VVGSKSYGMRKDDRLAPAGLGRLDCLCEITQPALETVTSFKVDGWNDAC